MKRVISAILVATLVLAATPARATDGDEAPATLAPVAHAQFQASIDDAVAAIANSPSGARRFSVGREENTGAGRVHRSEQSASSPQSGGGHAGMIIGLVGLVAGIAGTVYTLKVLKKTTDDAARQAGQ